MCHNHQSSRRTCLWRCQVGQIIRRTVMTYCRISSDGIQTRSECICNIIDVLDRCASRLITVGEDPRSRKILREIISEPHMCMSFLFERAECVSVESADGDNTVIGEQSNAMIIRQLDILKFTVLVLCRMKRSETLEVSIEIESAILIIQLKVQKVLPFARQ